MADAINFHDGTMKGALPPMLPAETRELVARLSMLRVEHRDLDAAIEALTQAPIPDQLLLARMKRRKLRLKDEISAIDDQLVPDIIA